MRTETPRRRQQKWRESKIHSGLAVILPWLLCHVAQDQMHVLISDGGAHAHMAHNGGHHSRRKLGRSGMAARAIGAKTSFALKVHVFLLGGLGINSLVRRSSRRGSSRIFRRAFAAT